MGYRREKAARGLLEVKQAPRAPVPRKTLERHEPLAPDEKKPSMGYRREKAARGLLEVKQAPRAPMPRKTLERHEPLAQDDINSLKKGAYTVLPTSASRAGSPRPLDGRRRKRRGRPDATPHGPTDQGSEA
jgi:hypothetical protein